MTDSLGQSQVLPYLGSLSKKGCSFTLISLEKEERYKTLKREIEQTCKTHNINWIPLHYEDKLPVISAFKNYRKLRKSAMAMNKLYHFDIVHCRSDIPGLIGRSLQKKQGTKFVFDMRGFWADERIEGKIWNPKNPVFAFLYRFFKKKELELFASANAVISLTEKGKSIIEKMPELNGMANKISVIPCCVDLVRFNPEAIDDQTTQDCKKELGIHEGTKVIGYLGSIGTWYMLEEMLAYYAAQRSTLTRSVFLFITGEDRSLIVDKAKLFDIPEREIITHRAPHYRVAEYISTFDLSVFFIRPTFSKSASSPTKQGELMAMQIPIVCNAGVGDTDVIIKKYKAGHVLETMDETPCSDSSLNNMNFDPVLSRQGAEEWFSLDKGSATYYNVYLQVLDNN